MKALGSGSGIDTASLAQSLVDEWPHGESGRVDVLMCHKDPSFGVGV